MCMQCTADAVLVKADVLPGYSLYQSRQKVRGWPKGYYGLVKSNDPLFVFKGPIMDDPCKGLTEDDLDVMMEYPDGYDKYEKAAKQVSNIKLYPLQAHEFIEACKSFGYSPEDHGTEFGFWFINHLAETIRT